MDGAGGDNLGSAPWVQEEHCRKARHRPASAIRCCTVQHRACASRMHASSLQPKWVRPTSVIQMSTRYCTYEAEYWPVRCSKQARHHKLEQCVSHVMHTGSSMPQSLSLQTAANASARMQPGTTAAKLAALPRNMPASHKSQQPSHSADLQPEDVGGWHMRLPAVLGGLLHTSVRLSLQGVARHRKPNPWQGEQARA